jgi:hypothetical protein
MADTGQKPLSGIAIRHLDSLKSSAPDSFRNSTHRTETETCLG